MHGKPDEVASARILIQLYYFVRAPFFGKSVTLFRVDVLDLTIRLRLPGEALKMIS
jgi:hypothetical protein